MTIFDVHNFVMDTLLGMAAAEPAYRVRSLALEWFSRGLLTSNDLAQMDIVAPISLASVADDVDNLTDTVDTMLTGGEGV